MHHTPAALAAALATLALAACGSSGPSATRYGTQVAAKATRGMREDIKRQFVPRIAADAAAVRTASRDASRLAAQQKLGIDIEGAMQAGWDRYAILDANVMVAEFERRLQGSPSATRNAAAEAMIAFARPLDGGRLPQGATAGIARVLEASYPGLAAYLRSPD
jgi:uncharacterized lipoprotein YmbA